MRLSSKKQSELYNVIASRIMDLRVELKQNPELIEIDALDSRLFNLEQEIWPGVKKALNIKESN